MKPTTTLILLSLAFSSNAFPQSAGHVVISEVYGGGGNSGSYWKNDFIELYNPTGEPVSLTGWSVQYASATGSTWSQITNLSGTIAPRRYYLVQQAQGTGGTQALPSPDATGTIAMGGTAGKIALVSGTAAITGRNDPAVVDFVGYGSTANDFEGSGPTPAPSNTASVERKTASGSSAATLAPGGGEEKSGNGWDTNDNAADFVAQSAISPQNSASPAEPAAASNAGIGSSLIRPPLVRADTSMVLNLVLYGDTAVAIAALETVVPSPFSWSHLPEDIVITGNDTAVLGIRADTIRVDNLGLKGPDSLLLSIQGLGITDTTARIEFPVRTGANPDSLGEIAQFPSVVVAGSPRAIADVRANDANGVARSLNDYVSIRGVVTVAHHFGGPAYVQDFSGGIAVYDIGFESSVLIGDEVTLTGWIDQFRGLTELKDVTVHETHGRGNDVDPLLLTASQIVEDGAGGIELYEGLLVRLNLVTVRDTSGNLLTTWSGGTSGTNYVLTDSTGSVQMRVDNNIDLVGQAAPQGEFDIIGVVGQFDQTSPYSGGYQVFPRFISDIISTGPIISEFPRESVIGPDAMTIAWKTVHAGTSHLRYGTTRSYEGGVVGDTASTTDHAVRLTGLQPATVYNVQAFSVSGSDTSAAGNIVVSTASLGSTGTMNIYFNKSIDASVSLGEAANGGTDLVSRLVTRIDSTKHSIDLCLYSLSGTPGPGDTVADALLRAKQRGVKIRAIGERDNNATAPWEKLRYGGIPVIDDGYDVANAGVGLMHNKFLVFDYRDTLSDIDDWIWTGSWNVTDPGTNSDFQNTIEIQDKALAGAFTREFNEMWGSDTDQPQASASRFGARKLDNTPHRFVVGGTPIELYFSPSDRVTSRLLEVLERAQHSIDAALLTLTRYDLGSALAAKHAEGVVVRILLDNDTDSGSQFGFLSANGVDALLDPNASALLHHKYAIVDAEMRALPATVVTGSHNWSNSAENTNNENTLIIQDNRIANLYLQEFKARYIASGGQSTIAVGMDAPARAIPDALALSPNFPNPFNPSTSVTLAVPVRSEVRVSVLDLLGREVAVLAEGVVGAGLHTLTWNAAGRSSGIYFMRVQMGGGALIRKMVLLR